MNNSFELSANNPKEKTLKSLYSRFYNRSEKLKFGGSAFSLLALSACGGGGGGGAAAPTNNTPAPAPTPALVAGFTEIITNTWLADNNLDSTFSRTTSSATLTVSGRDGDDTISTGNGSDVLFGEGGADVLNGGGGDDVLDGGTGADQIHGGSGLDFVSYVSSSSGVTVNLATGMGSGGEAQGDTYTSIEGVFGSNQNDTIIGNGNDNLFEGLNGADSFDGGAGEDYVSYIAATSGAIVNLAANTGSGAANGDTFANIEGLIGSNHNDILTGDAGNNYFEASAGNDTVNGGGGNDTIFGISGSNTLNGDAGDDAIVGGINNDVINGGGDNDFISGGVGSDDLDGGAGVDWLDYSTSTSGVTVNLATNTVSGGDANGDTIANFENVNGSEQVDIITGDANDNIIDGWGGVDTISGGTGDDTLLAFQVDASHQDTFDGGADDDTLAFIGASLVVPYAIDLSTVSVTNIESINLDYVATTNFIENLTLTAQDVLDVTDGDNLLLVEGDAADSVTSTGQGWVQGADQVIDTVTYNTYTSGAATLLIDEDVTQTIS